ncbi:MAG: LamG domain-containing protein [Treponema sp.]|nr:LamG domain-containing protein [Treponema sp.]
MKKSFVKVFSALSLVSLLGFGISSCADDSGEDESFIVTSTDFVGDVLRNLSSLSVDSSSATTIFSVGAKFSTSGLVVTASYDDGTTADVTSQATFSYTPAEGEDAVSLVSGTTVLNTAGTHTVTVSFTKGSVTKTCAYSIEVTDSTTPSANIDDETSYTITDTKLTYNSDASLANITLPAFDVSSSEIFTVSFNATFDSSQSDWAAQILTTSDNFILTAPNLDPWNNTRSGSTISGKNAYPGASGSYLSNSLAYNSAFTGESVAITVSFNKTDKSIVYTLGGKAWVVYTSGVWDGGIEEFITAVSDSLSAGTLKFNASSLSYSNLVITKGRASSATASEIALSSSSVTDSSDNWKSALESLSGVVVYSDGSADSIALTDENVTLSYKSGETSVEESAIAVGSYTVTVSCGDASTTVALTVTSNYENTVTGSGTASDPYVLSSTLATTVSEKSALDCCTYQSSTTWDSSATYCWNNPLYGKSLESVTISFLLNNATGSSYDSILTFFKDGGTGWGGVAFAENGTAHAQGHGYWDIALTENDSNIVPASTWTRVTYVIEGGNVTAYVDGVQKGTATCSDSGNTVSYLTGTCDKVAIGVGFNSELWLAGYVDENTYLSDIRIYSTALSAEQVAAIE